MRGAGAAPDGGGRGDAARPRDRRDQGDPRRGGPPRGPGRRRRERSARRGRLQGASGWRVAATDGRGGPGDARGRAGTMSAARELTITVRVNGEPHQLTVPPSELLIDCLRERLGLLGVKKSCDV